MDNLHIALHGRCTLPVSCRHDSLVFQSNDWKQYGAVILGWHSDLLFRPGSLSVPSIIPDYFGRMTGWQRKRTVNSGTPTVGISQCPLLTHGVVPVFTQRTNRCAIEKHARKISHGNMDSNIIEFVHYDC